MRGRRKKRATSSALWLPTLAVSLFGGFAPPAARQTAAVFFMLLAVAPMNDHHVTAAWFGSVSVEQNALLIAAWQVSEMWVPSAIERWHSQQSDLPVLIHALRAVLFDRYHKISIPPNISQIICNYLASLSTILSPHASHVTWISGRNHNDIKISQTAKQFGRFFNFH